MGDYGGYGNENDDYGGYGGYGNYNNAGFEAHNPAAGGGGGFMTSSSPMMTSPTRSSNKKRIDSVTPLTIKQVLHDCESNSDSFSLDGREITKVWMYGRVVKVEIKPVQVTYTVDDGTGAIDCTVWINETNENTAAQEQRESIQEDMYVKVIGHIRTFNNKRSISAFSIRPVEDMNEVMHHYLSVILTNLEVTRGPLNPQLREQQPVKSNSPMNMQPTNTYNSVPGTLNFHQGVEGYDSEFTPLQQMVLDAFQEKFPSDNGLHVNQVIQKLAAHRISEADIRRSISELVDDGHLYSTIDDQHFKTTVEP